jgi:hypothetical protein
VTNPYGDAPASALAAAEAAPRDEGIAPSGDGETAPRATAQIVPPPALPRPNRAADPVALAETRVNSVIAELDAVDGWPPADQLGAFATAQQALQATLASIDDH